MNSQRTTAIRPRTTSPANYNPDARWYARFSRDIRLRDGSELRLRELRPGDRERLKAFFAGCSPEAIYYRFLSPIKSLSDSLLDYLADADGSRHVALIVTQGRKGDDESIVAEGRYVIFKERPAEADIAFLVVDEMRRRGIATLLIHELVEIARRNGVFHFSADVLADNRAMLSLLRKTAKSPSFSISHGLIHFQIPITCDEARMMSKVA